MRWTTEKKDLILVDPEAAFGFGHGAIALVNNDTCTVFSFAGNVAAGMANTQDWIDLFLFDGIPCDISMYEMKWDDFLTSPKCGPDTYSEGIMIEISYAQYSRLLNQAIKEYYKQSKSYSLLNYNCMDFVLDLLNSVGVTLHWKNDGAAELEANVLLISEAFGVVGVATFYTVLSDAGYDYTVPKAVFEQFTGATGEVEGVAKWKK